MIAPYETECRACRGEGERYVTASGLPRAPNPVTCTDCGGSGWIKCDGPPVGKPCKFTGANDCQCQDAWEAQNERLHTEEPPLSADERHRMAWREKQIAKGRTA